MKRILSLFFILFVSQVVGQQYLQKQKERILSVCVNNLNDSTCLIFSTEFDSLSKNISDSSLSKKYSTDLKHKIFFDLQQTTESTIQSLPLKITKYKALNHYLEAVQADTEKAFFNTLAPEKIIEILPYIKDSKALHEYLNQISYTHGISLLKSFESYENKDFAEKILTSILHVNPVLLKRYYSNKAIQEKLFSSSSDTIKTFLALYEDVGPASKAYLLFDKILNNKLSIKEADSLSENKIFLLQKLTNISKEKDAIGKQAIDNELGYICAQIIRPINADFEAHNNPNRFKPLETYSAEELYTILVNSEEEIFTSSFTGGFKLLTEKIKAADISTYTFLEHLNFNEFRTFIKMCSGYGLLDVFLENMTPIQQEQLFQQFLVLENGPFLLKNAVSIADAFGSISHADLLTFIEKNLLTNYKNTGEENVKLAYGLLIKLFHTKTQNEAFHFIASQYPIKPLSSIDSTSLFGNDGIHTQLHLFYDDEDGMISFSTFLQSFKSKLWQIDDYEDYVEISSKSGAPISIYANKAKEEKEGTEAILKLLKKESKEVEVLVHRGHSFYVNKSLEKLSAATKIVLLGSCGGYHKVLNVLEKAPEAQIIATKQVGSYVINNPLLLQLATDVNQKQTINWEDFWEKLYNKVNTNLYAKDKFNEYIPPHQNLGAAFIQAYKEYK